MINETRVIGQFLELVQIDSETKHERLIADYLKNKLSELGLGLVEDGSQAETGHGAGNLIATLAASGSVDAEPFLFSCHMDTVEPGKGIKPVVGEDGWIRSDGTTILGADDKAGLAVLLEVIQVLRERNIPHGKIQFVISAGEESNLRGARALDVKHLDAKFGFALDTNGEVGTICVGAPTLARVEIEIFGKSAHAGVNPEDGISAIQVAGKAIARMNLGRIDDETTANIGKFEGGGPTNVVPDHVKLYGEARSLSQVKVERQLEEMKEAVEAVCREYGAKGNFHSEIMYRGFLISEEETALRIARKAAAALDMSGDTFVSGGGSDANVLNGYGIPTVNLAIGYENIHTTEEKIKADDIVKAAEFALEIVRQSCIV
ncbi:M20/M25/M40 family metallo-hydrolase [Paenibacillus macerans]|uniref:M42 glutamyl aminopeptidase family protein n=1 Tax=Paenibacillus macerans TaxID=44252 RepID=A0A090ZH16_PAEMA|nr:M20/M25/M40 family metallo-hydrolase [Paenibacillus macerans]KFN09525.1 M42 glutamyl aminopeptidase family protein [Paenibacillus macerans]MBS5909538.1 M20/M25/M40 family metallo-hydrolase [Paenibacillus macerans]MCY7557757.1 M20/M25/M40 family metallo-hydrolase [Paenibacillus macerans]MEC0137224.1 M20/M25/M40 family metallo-hydrolase [Paenibacillus macerans]MEC0150519.1 M20/M25/M40 family metallo-hydrolase [Paenibacillus macerans]